MQNIYQEKMQLSRNINSKFAHDDLLDVFRKIYSRTKRRLYFRILQILDIYNFNLYI